MTTPNYSSRYIKTLYQEDLKDSSPITLRLTPETDLIPFLKDLITDLIQRRNIEWERILIITDSAWLKHAIFNCLETSFETQMDHFMLDCMVLVCNLKSSNFIHPNSHISACIALNYLQISENQPELLDNFIENNQNSLFIGLDDQSCDREFLKPLLGGSVREINYEPSSFEDFMNKDVLVWLRKLLQNYPNYPEIVEASEIIFGRLNQLNPIQTFSINIGTSTYVESNEVEDEDQEGRDSEDIHEFLITIEFSKNQLDFSIELQDFDWDGTAFYVYTLNIEEEIEETFSGEANKFEKYMNEIKDRLNKYRDFINFNFIGFKN